MKKLSIEEKTVPTMSLDEAIKHCEEKSCGNNACALEHKQLAKWLKELKELRLQSQWKPSDGQMQALSNAGNSFRPFEEGHKVLWSLYNDLKKLRVE